MTSTGVRVVCFDLGGVIVRICRSWEEGCAAAGVAAHPEWRAPEALPARMDLLRRFDRGQITAPEFYEGIAGTSSGLYTPDEIRRVHGAWLLGEYPGVAGVVERLSELPHVETACLSNTNCDHWSTMLAGYPTLASLRHRHASHLLGLRKPDEECFRAFERELGRTPREILFFDDLPENIEAAERRGWRTEHVDHTGDTASQIAETLRKHGVW